MRPTFEQRFPFRFLTPIFALFWFLSDSPKCQAEELIDLGDHKLEVIRSGRGSPTVIFQAGLGSNLNTWKGFVNLVGTTAIAYSRAGQGKSDPSKKPPTPSQITEELHTLLERAGFKPPFVLVGQSLGALYCRVYAMTYPSDVAGLVLVDGTPDRWEFEQRKLAQPENTEPTPWPPRADPKWDATTRAEFEGVLPIVTSGELGVSGNMQNIPTAIITSLRTDGTANSKAVRNLARALHSEEFQSTTYGLHIVTDRSGHGIPGDEPYLVLGAIRWVIEATHTQK